jgi:hypothetical protein
MNITLEFLETNSACQTGIKFFKKEFNKPIEHKIFINKLIEKDRYQWAYWVIVKILNKTNNIKFTIYAAESVLFLFEKEYPDDNRPRKAIEAAKNCLKNKTADVEAANAAYAAASSAYNAAYVAYAAADTDTAYAAADAYTGAADAAYAAGGAACTADVVAVYAADAVEAVDATYTGDTIPLLKTDTINYGLKLIEEQEQEQNNDS